MADPKTVINARRAEHLMASFSRRNIESEYHETPASAVQAICDCIAPGSVVGLGGSVTIVETGLVEALRHLDITLLDRYREGLSSVEIMDIRKKSMYADCFISSCNAITLDGRLVNEDSFGNRVAAMMFGPEKVIVLAGMNKVVPNVDDAIRRIRTVAAPLNCIRFGINAPCSISGVCDDANCFSPQRICNQLTIIEGNIVPGRLRVVLVNADLGF